MIVPFPFALVYQWIGKPTHLPSVDLKNLVASSTVAFHLLAKANGEKSHPR
jgi:hypothetical protein